MKKNKGFTLIELIAVIAVLAIVALIIVPTISKMMKETRKNAFEDTAYGLIKAGQQYYAKNDMLDDKITDIMFEFPNKVQGLEITGELPESGYMKIDKDGNITLAISNGRYCVTKKSSETKVTVTGDLENCTLEKTLTALATTETGVEIPTCITNKTVCTGETLVAIKVNNTDVYNFYVIADNNTEVTLIMDSNLGSTVSWYSDDEYNSNGPITAINYLDELTDDEWSNIPSKAYTYSGIGDDGTTRVYEDITRTMRARMITYAEVNAIKIANNGILPSYMHGGGSRYWTSTASAVDSNGAWDVSYNGGLGYINVNYVYGDGLRPVITLSK